MIWKKSFLIFLFSLSVAKGAVDCETMKKSKEFPSPNLNSTTNAVTRGQNVSLVCSNRNSSLRILYCLFRGQQCLQTQNKTGEPMVVNLTIAEVRDLGPYKCKATVSSCWKYSHEFNFTFIGGESCPSCILLLIPGLLLLIIVIILVLAFWFQPKCKARKVMRQNACRDSGKAPTEAGIYENTCQSQADERPMPDWKPRQHVSTAQDETRYSQEIHYASPMFQKEAPSEQEACNDCKMACVYSELIL